MLLILSTQVKGMIAEFEIIYAILWFDQAVLNAILDLIHEMCGLLDMVT